MCGADVQRAQLLDEVDRVVGPVSAERDRARAIRPVLDHVERRQPFGVARDEVSRASTMSPERFSINPWPMLDGNVIGRTMQRHRHQKFLRFLGAVERAVPAGKVIHAILDNYAAHKHPKVRAWLERHRRWTFHFTPHLMLLAELPSRAFSPSFPGAGSSAACSARRRTSRQPSTASSTRPTIIPNPSSGRATQPHHRRRQQRAPTVKSDPLAGAAIKVYDYPGIVVGRLSRIEVITSVQR
jgi:hypothetical protein